MHWLFVGDLAFGASQKKSCDGFLPDASSRVRRRRRYIESEENKHGRSWQRGNSPWRKYIYTFELQRHQGRAEFQMEKDALKSILADDPFGTV